MNVRFVEWAFVAVVLGVIASLLIPAVREAGTGPRGEMIPTKPPKETNRVQHPSGLSIVLPENWEQKDSLPMLVVIPRGYHGRRVPAFIQVEPIRAERLPELSTFQRITFQAIPAFEKMTVERESTFDDPARSRYILYVERDSQWFEVVYLVADKYTELPTIVRQYLETIQWPSPKDDSKPAE